MKPKLLLASLLIAACNHPPAGTAGALSRDTMSRGPAASAGLTHDTSSAVRPAGAAGPIAHDSSSGVRPAGVAGPRPLALFLGTSLTAGLGLDPDSAYTSILQRKLDSAGIAVRVVNAGVSGETSAGALRRTAWLLSRDTVALFVIETGANDGLRGQDPDSTAANIQGIIDLVRKVRPTPDIALMQMYAVTNLGVPYGRKFGAIFPSLARKNGVELVPFLLRGVAGIDSLNQNDGVHPNVQGEKIVAENLWRALEEEFRKAAARNHPNEAHRRN